MIDLSVIVVTFNSERYIAACLRSLTAALDGLASEIVVVDNASADGTVAAVASAGMSARVIGRDVNGGFASAINVGLGATTGRYVLWLNPDAEIVGGRLSGVLQWLDAHPDVGIAGLRLVDEQGRVEPSDRGFPSYHSALGHRYSLLTRVWPSNPFSLRYLRPDRDRAVPGEADWVSGAALVHRRDVSATLRGLDEQFFMYCEDVDFCYRARQSGWRTAYVPLVTVRHAIGGSASAAKPAMIRARHESLWRYYRKHFRRGVVKDAVTWAGIFGRARWLLLYDRLGGRRVK